MALGVTPLVVSTSFSATSSCLTSFGGLPEERGIFSRLSFSSFATLEGVSALELVEAGARMAKG